MISNDFHTTLGRILENKVEDEDGFMKLVSLTPPSRFNLFTWSVLNQLVSDFIFSNLIWYCMWKNTDQKWLHLWLEKKCCSNLIIFLMKNVCSENLSAAHDNVSLFISLFLGLKMWFGFEKKIYTSIEIF